jgi:SHS2 domain-containing protein
MKLYEEVPHTADWSLRVRGATLAELFAHAAEGMYALMDAQPERGGPEATREVQLEAYDLESLLVAWLNELLYLTESENLRFVRFRIGSIENSSLAATAIGVTAPDLNQHIKAVTFHDLRVVETGEGLETTIVFDV